MTEADRRGLAMLSCSYFKRNVIYAGGFFFILFATQDVFLQIWSLSLYSYSAGKANSGSLAAVAEQPAPMLLI